MASLPQFTVSEYNNVARMDDVEHATYLLTKLEEDARHLMDYLTTMHHRYTEGVPQTTCDQVRQLAEDLSDRLRRVDPAQQAEYDAWNNSQAIHTLVAHHDAGKFQPEDTHQRYLDKYAMNREMADSR